MKEITKALVKVQSELKPVELDKENPFFHSKYSTLGAILDSCRELLVKNDLALVQTFKITEKGNALVTTLLHISGEFISSEVLLNPVKNDPQQMGSATTYFRRYSLAALIGLVSDSDEDGNIASQLQEPVKELSQPSNGHEEYAVISPKQAGRLYAIAKSNKWADDSIKQELKMVFGYEHSKDIKKDDYDKICKHFGFAIG